RGPPAREVAAQDGVVEGAAATPSISRMPRPPRGPSWRMTTTSPGLISRRVTAAIAPSSRSKTRAGPRVHAALVARHLHHAAAGREVTLQDDEAAARLERTLERPHDPPGPASRPRAPLARQSCARLA